MSVPSLKEILENADKKQVAVGHFNIAEISALDGVFAAARELNFPILIGVSEGERKFIGVKQAAALIRSLREEYGFPIYLNADHTHTLDNVREAAEAGFDEILFDGSKLPLDDDIAQTKEAVAIVRGIEPNIVVEGEIGYIGSNSEVVSERPKLALSTPEEAERFVKETGVDVLAPAVGNMHGLLKSQTDGGDRTRLNIGLIGEIKKAIGPAGCRFMTLHGGSGTADEDFVAAAKTGMTIIHVSSELRLAWRRGVEEGLKEHPDEIAPYKILPPAVEGIRKIVADRLKLFNGA